MRLEEVIPERDVKAISVQMTFEKYTTAFNRPHTSQPQEVFCVLWLKVMHGPGWSWMTFSESSLPARRRAKCSAGNIVVFIASSILIKPLREIIFIDGFQIVSFN